MRHDNRDDWIDTEAKNSNSNLTLKLIKWTIASMTVTIYKKLSPNLCDIRIAFSNFLCCLLQTPFREELYCINSKIGIICQS